MIDHNRDGFIDKEDLHDMLASLGKVKLKRLKGLCTFLESLVRFTLVLIKASSDQE